MNSCEKFIQDLEKRLPNLCRPEHLVEIGIFKYRQSADLARRAGRGPDFFKIGRKIFYPREGIVKWLKDSTHAISETANQAENGKDKNI
jgi:hypothetical protein